MCKRSNVPEKLAACGDEMKRFIPQPDQEKIMNKKRIRKRNRPKRSKRKTQEEF